MSDTKEDINLLPEDIRKDKERDLVRAREHAPAAPTILHAPQQKKEAGRSLGMRLRISRPRFHIPWGEKKEDDSQVVAKAALPSYDDAHREEMRTFQAPRPVMHERSVIQREPLTPSPPPHRTSSTPSWWQKLMTPELRTQDVNAGDSQVQQLRSLEEEKLIKIKVQLPPESAKKLSPPHASPHPALVQVKKSQAAPHVGFLAKLIASWKARRAKRIAAATHARAVRTPTPLPKTPHVTIPQGGQMDVKKKEDTHVIHHEPPALPHPLTVPTIPTETSAPPVPLPAVHIQSPAHSFSKMHRHVHYSTTALAVLSTLGVSLFLAGLNWLAFQEVSRLAVLESDLETQIEEKSSTLAFHEAAANPYLEIAAQSVQLEKMLDSRTAFSPSLSRILGIALRTGAVQNITVRGAELEVVSVVSDYDALSRGEDALTALAASDAVDIASVRHLEDGSLVVTYVVRMNTGQ